jgi:hypothetical protein
LRLLQKYQKILLQQPFCEPWKNNKTRVESGQKKPRAPILERQKNRQNQNKQTREIDNEQRIDGRKKADAS